MWITLENNLGYFLLFNYRNKHLGLFCALKAKPLSNWHFLQWWHETCHMPIFETPTINQHNNNSHKLPTQHTQCNHVGITLKDSSNWPLIFGMTQCTIMHMVLLGLTILSFRQHFKIYYLSHTQNNMPYITSNVVDVIYCRYTKFPSSNLQT
jgi:hypothetical protein